MQYVAKSVWKGYAYVLTHARTYKRTHTQTYCTLEWVIASLYRRILYTSIVPVNREQHEVEKILRKNQNGFRRNRSTTQVLTIRRITKGVYCNSSNYQRSILWGCPRGVMVKAMNCGIVVREFVLQSRYYVHFRANTLGKGMNPLILPPTMGK